MKKYGVLLCIVIVRLHASEPSAEWPKDKRRPNIKSEVPMKVSHLFYPCRFEATQIQSTYLVQDSDNRLFQFGQEEDWKILPEFIVQKIREGISSDDPEKTVSEAYTFDNGKTVTYFANGKMDIAVFSEFHGELKRRYKPKF